MENARITPVWAIPDELKQRFFRCTHIHMYPDAHVHRQVNSGELRRALKAQLLRRASRRRTAPASRESIHARETTSRRALSCSVHSDGPRPSPLLRLFPDSLFSWSPWCVIPQMFTVIESLGETHVSSKSRLFATCHALYIASACIVLCFKRLPILLTWGKDIIGLVNGIKIIKSFYKLT